MKSSSSTALTGQSQTVVDQALARAKTTAIPKLSQILTSRPLARLPCGGEPNRALLFRIADLTINGGRIRGIDEHGGSERRPGFGEVHLRDLSRRRHDAGNPADCQPGDRSAPLAFAARRPVA